MAKARKVVAIGPSGELFCLKSLGAEFVPLRPDGNLEEELRKHASDPTVGLILVSEPVAQGKHALIAELRHERRAVVLVVPSYRGTSGTTLSFMKRTLEQSIGVDLISKG